jgi:urea transporter
MASLYNSLLILGRGIGQVMFQNNALSGLLMLIGIFLNSWQMGILALSGNIISTLTAHFSGYGRDDIKNGLYGFNGTLVGIAVGVFMELSLGSLLLMVVAACISTWIARLLNLQRSLPGFTAPFILSVWMLLGFCSWIMPDILLVSDTVTDATQGINYFQTFSFGIGQVMFQGNIWTGLLFLVGILVNSRTAAFYTVIGALFPIPLAILLGIDAETLNMGLMGYNGVLCAIALGDRTLKSLVWDSCSVLLSTLLQIIGMNLEITTLTAPFVVSVWIIMGIQKLVSVRIEKS